MYGCHTRIPKVITFFLFTITVSSTTCHEFSFQPSNSSSQICLLVGFHEDYIGFESLTIASLKDLWDMHHKCTNSLVEMFSSTTTNTPSPLLLLGTFTSLEYLPHWILLLSFIWVVIIEKGIRPMRSTRWYETSSRATPCPPWFRSLVVSLE